MHLLDAHPFGVCLTCVLVVNAIAAGMPAPEPASGIAYRWLHGSLNALALNVETLARTRYARIPQLPPPCGPNSAVDPGAGKTPSP